MRKQHAFTLLEILLSLTISTLILGAAGAAYITAMNGWQKSRSRSENFQYARAALDRIVRAIEGALPPDENAGLVFTHVNLMISDTEFSADSLRISTAGARIATERGRAIDFVELEFYVEVDEETGEPALFMRERVPSSRDTEEYPGKTDELAPNVFSFDVEFYDGMEWTAEWTQSDSLPEAVRVTLELFDFEGEEDPLVFTRLIRPRLVSS